MKIISTALLILQFFLINVSFAEKLPSKDSIKWHNWSNETFQLAEKEHKLVLLDIGAEWCHFCAKMKAVTYQDPKVINIINKNYIAIYADIDDSDDIRMLYGNLGVPGTIILNSDRDELNKRLGYIAPQQMQWHLLGSLQDASETMDQN